MSTFLSPPQGGDQGHTHVVIKTKFYYPQRRFHVGSMIKEPTFSAGAAGDENLIPGLGRFPRRGTTIHLSILAWRIPKQKSLVSYSPWGGKSWRQISDLACSTSQENAHMIHGSDPYFFWIYGEMFPVVLLQPEVHYCGLQINILPVACQWFLTTADYGFVRTYLEKNEI